VTATEPPAGPGPTPSPDAGPGPAPTPDASPRLEVRGLTVRYGRTTVVDGVDLHAGAAETLAILGPSGAGKSTILAAIAGFLRPAAGEIRVDGRSVVGRGVNVPPEGRSVGVAFQNGALWPHLTVEQTVAYPLERRGLDPGAVQARTTELLTDLGIAWLAGRRPAELSGGEQQRTGLARALARGAAVYLLDEPTAHLDTALKGSLQAQVADLCRRDGAAVLYATHDVGEALAVADRVAIIRAGRLVQTGTPREVYDRPIDAWAAALTGVASVIEGTAAGYHDGRPTVRLSAWTVGLEEDTGASEGAEHLRLMVRPDWVRLGGEVPGRVVAVLFRGSHTDLELETPVGWITVREPGPPSVGPGDAVTWHLRRAWALPTPAPGGWSPAGGTAPSRGPGR
jgi:ABC-type Fe3+/spermidine/putrescine transport system ATPase subunit